MSERLMHPSGTGLRGVVRSLPADYWFLWIGTLINRLGGFVAPFLALYLTADRHLSVADASFIVALFGAGSFLAALVGGDLSDRLGRRPVMLVSFLSTPAAVMVVGLVRSTPVIAACTFLLGFVTDLYRPAVSAAVSDLVPASMRTRAYGYLYWAINVGAAVAPMVAGLMARWSYLPLFIGDAATTLGYGLIVLSRIRESRPAEGEEGAGGEAAGATDGTAEGTPVAGREARAPHRRAGSPASSRRRIADALRDPLLLAFAGLSLLAGMVYAQGYSTLPIDMQAHNAGPAAYGLAIAVNGLVVVLLGIPASHSSVRWPRMAAMATAAVLTGVGFGMNALFHTLLFYVASVVVWTLGEIAQASVAPSIVAELAPARLRGLYQGIYGASWGLAFFAGPAIGGWVLQQLGSGVLWGASLVLGLLVAAGYLAIRRAASRRMRVSSGP